MKFDHAYLVVKDLKKSAYLFTRLFGQDPIHVESGWVDWQVDKSPYFGLMSVEDWGRGLGNNIGGVSIIAFRSDDLEKDLEVIRSLGAKIIEPITNLNNTEYDYTYFIFEDFDGHQIEVAKYSR